jgi:hypothetical protein
MRSSVLTTVMRTTIFGLFGSTLIAASMANAAPVSKHFTRHYKTCASERVRSASAFDSYSPYAFRPEAPNAFEEDQNGFGTTSPWPSSGMQPDDWRQSVNGN